MITKMEDLIIIQKLKEIFKEFSIVKLKLVKLFIEQELEKREEK